MIIEACLNLVYWIFGSFLSSLSFSSGTMSGIASVVASFLPWFEQGAGVIATFTHFQYLLGLLSAVIALKAFFMAYNVLMWLFRKIPFWGVKE